MLPKVYHRNGGENKGYQEDGDLQFLYLNYVQFKSVKERVL